jgi:uncharacterized membrane protein HdeD (DUF308 family)
MSGFLLVRQELHLKRNKLFLILGISGVLAEFLVLTCDLTQHWVAEDLVRNLLGTVILLTGILHMVSGFQFGRHAMLGRTGVGTLMGVFEIGLGALLILSKTGRGQTIFIIATQWALLGGTFLLIDAFRQRRQTKSSS